MSDAHEDHHERDNEYEVVMPFVTVASVGGPHDDDAYTAGWEMGNLDAVLSTGRARVETQIHTVNAAQADLIAMRHGYRCTTQSSPAWPEWSHAVFDPSAKEER